MDERLGMKLSMWRKGDLLDSTFFTTARVMHIRIIIVTSRLSVCIVSYFPLRELFILWCPNAKNLGVFGNCSDLRAISDFERRH